MFFVLFFARTPGIIWELEPELDQHQGFAIFYPCYSQLCLKVQCSPPLGGEVEGEIWTSAYRLQGYSSDWTCFRAFYFVTLTKSQKWWQKLEIFSVLSSRPVVFHYCDHDCSLQASDHQRWEIQHNCTQTSSADNWRHSVWTNLWRLQVDSVRRSDVRPTFGTIQVWMWSLGRTSEVLDRSEQGEG